MDGRFDDNWMATVCERLDAVFAAADAGFSRSAPQDPAPARLEPMLWETDAGSFLARYPDSGIRASYGEQWPPPCIDYWVEVTEASTHAVLSVEGWSAQIDPIPLTGAGEEDAVHIADALATVLGVDPAPRQAT
ncbi:MAG: hypothetical protein LWW86_01600 [Micrococcales bacterium]|nr:hypothetical protein [Micrococcales bacterium]